MQSKLSKGRNYGLQSFESSVKSQTAFILCVQDATFYPNISAFCHLNLFTLFRHKQDFLAITCSCHEPSMPLGTTSSFLPGGMLHVMPASLVIQIINILLIFHLFPEDVSDFSSLFLFVVVKPPNLKQIYRSVCTLTSTAHTPTTFAKCPLTIALQRPGTSHT